MYLEIKKKIIQLLKHFTLLVFSKVDEDISIVQSIHSILKLQTKFFLLIHLLIILFVKLISGLIYKK